MVIKRFSKSKKKKFNLVFIISAVVLLIIFIFIFYYFPKQNIASSCGETAFVKNLSGEIMPIYFPQKPMICITNNLMSGCKTGNAIILDENKDTLNYEILGVINGKCTIKITYIKVDNIFSNKGRFVNKYIECPIDEFGKDVFSFVKTENDKSDLAVSYFGAAMFELVRVKSNCTGSLIDLAKSEVRNSDELTNLPNCDLKESFFDASKVLEAFRSGSLNFYKEKCNNLRYLRTSVYYVGNENFGLYRLSDNS